MQTPKDVEINETNFPDEYFRQWLLDQEYGKDALLTAEEIAKIKTINFWGTYLSRGHIQSLQGIEYLTSLQELKCSSQSISSIDVSKNAALRILECSNNLLTSLDVSKAPSMSELICQDNQLTSINVAGCTSLKDLVCDNNKLTSINVAGCTSLKDLVCDNNKLTSIDVSTNTNLIQISCRKNQLTSLDVTNLTKLSSLSIYCNRIKGAAMDALVASLPTISGGRLTAISRTDEQNVMTTTQVEAAKAKGWGVYTDLGYEEYPGVEE